MLVVYVQCEAEPVCVHAYEFVVVLVCWYCFISCAANRIEYNEELVDDRCLLIRSTRIRCAPRSGTHTSIGTLIVRLMDRTKQSKRFLTFFLSYFPSFVSAWWICAQIFLPHHLHHSRAFAVSYQTIFACKTFFLVHNLIDFQVYQFTASVEVRRNWMMNTALGANGMASTSHE